MKREPRNERQAHQALAASRQIHRQHYTPPRRQSGLGNMVAIVLTLVCFAAIGAMLAH